MLKLHRFIATTAALALGHLSLLGSSAVCASLTDNLSEIPQGVTMSAQQLASAPLKDLRAQLTPHGWGVERDTEGNLLLYPGATSTAPAESTFASLETDNLNNVSDTDSVPPQSQAQNSQPQTEVQQTASDTRGNSPSPIAALSTPKQTETASLSKDQPQENLTRKFSNERFAQAEVEQWRTSLQPHGWGVETDTAGNLLLFPGGAEPAATYANADIAKPEITKTTKAKFDMATLEVTKPTNGIISGCGPEAVNQLRAALSPHGWQVKTDPRGVLLFPRTS